MKNNINIITELPMRGKLINWKATIGMTIEVEHLTYGKVKFLVINYTPNKNRLFLDYNGYIKDDGIFTGSFMDGNLGGVMNIINSSKNTFYLDENNILHIYGENKDGKWEALYSGSHVEEVMNSSWCANNSGISTNTYNFQGAFKYLHHVDIKPKPHMVIDHISNSCNLIDKFYDCRIENLREVTMAENNKNKKCRNEWGYTGLQKKGKGWRSSFKYNNTSIFTKSNDNFNEAIIDNLITQRYLGYKHQEEEFFRLNGLSQNRIRKVTDLLDIKMKKANNKIHEIKEYEYDIEQKDSYYILKKNGHEMLFDCDLDYIKDKNIYPVVKNNGAYWNIKYIEGNKKNENSIHRDILEFKPNEYKDYKIHVDHLNNNPSDNRFYNLSITTNYSNYCNKKGIGYRSRKHNSYYVHYMSDYKFWSLIGGVKEPVFNTEEEAFKEVKRRKTIIDNARVKLKNKLELDELIQYCMDNNYTLENGLADLDLGYLYWKGIIKQKEIA